MLEAICSVRSKKETRKRWNCKQKQFLTAVTKWRHKQVIALSFLFVILSAIIIHVNVRTSFLIWLNYTTISRSFGQTRRQIFNKCHCVKSVRIRSYSASHFSIQSLFKQCSCHKIVLCKRIIALLRFRRNKTSSR